MPNKKKLYDALVQEGYKDFENEEAFNTYVDNADNRKTLFNALKQVGYDIESEKAFDDYLGYSEPQIKGERINNTISGGVGTQEEADSIFDANAKAIREKYAKEAAQPDQGTEVSESEIKRLQGIKDAAQKQIDEAGFFDRFFDADTRVAVATRNQAEEALETYEEAKHANEGWFDRNVMGVLRGIADKATDLSTWDFGITGIASATALNDAYKKWEKGEQLTSAEQNMLDAYGLATAVQAAYQDKVGMAYKVGGSLPESAAFSASFILNPAAGVGKKIAETTAKAAVKKYGTSMVAKFAKGAARVGGDVAEMAVATGIPGAGRIAEDYYNRLNGQTTFDIDENGIVRYGGQVEQEEADDAIWKAFGSQFIENYSEAMGNYFAPMGTMLSNLTSKGLKAAHLGKLADVVNDISSSQFSRGLKRFKDATKFDGLVGEYLEEVAGNVINAATVGDMNFNSPEDPRSVFNPETNIETFLSCSLMSGTMYAVEAPVSVYNRNVAKKNLGNADKAASKLWGDRWEDMRSQMDEADPQHLAQLLTGVQNATDLTEEQKAAAKNYGMRLMQYQGYNARRLQNQAESTDEANEINNAYDRGADAVNPADKHNAKTAMDKAEAVLADDSAFLQEIINGQDNPVATITAMVESGKYSEDQIAKAKDYYVAYRRMNGLTDAVLDRVNSQIEDANKEVDANTNIDENTGTRTIIPVTLRDGRQGYVIKGTITPGEEGGIDINKSDSYIVVRVDGKNLPMNPNKDLVSVGQITTPETLKEYNNTQLREQLINQEIGEIDWNPATPNPKVGDSFEMDGVAVTIVSHDGQGGMFVVPTDQWQAAQGNEKQVQKLVMQAQQAGVVPASMFKQWASDQLDAQEEAVAAQQEVASGEAVGEQVNAGVNNSETPNGSNLSPVEDKHPMTEDEAASFIFQMEANAEPIPEIEFTPENWKAAFGENGTIETPIGTVKMGENQISKLFLKKRTKEFGMIAPTLSNPDIIIEEFSRAKEGESERESSYLFIKTFIKDGQKVRYYTSVTVLQEGMEVSISSHVLGEKQVPKKLMEGNVIYIKEALLSNSSDGHLAEQPNAVPDLLPTQESNAPLSTNKDSKKNVQSQEKEQKPFHEREKEDVFRELGEMYGDKMPHKVEVTAKALADDVAKAQKKLDDAQEKLDNAPIGRDSKQKEARDKAQQELDAIKIEANFWNEMDADIKKAQAEREAMLNPKVEVNMSEEPMDASEFASQQLANGNITLTSESFKKETGYGEAERKKFMKIIRKAENGGMTIEEAGERLMEMDRENGTNFFDQSDPNAGRDAIINMLGMARTWGDIANYIRDNRQRQAEADVEGIRSEMEEAIWNAYHVTPEEYATMLEMEMQENPYEGVDLAALDAIFAEKEFGEEQKSEEYESGTDVEGNQGQSELLSEEQPGDTTGDQPGETVKQDEGIGGGTPVEGETPQAGSSVGRGVNVFAEAERIDKEERRRKPLRERAREWSNALGVKVNFLESIDDVDAQTRAQIEAEHANGSGVPGWVAPSGEVYFFMPDLQDIKDIDETYIHEVVAHIGMEKLLGKERFAELCDKVWEMMPQSEKDYYENEYPGVKEIKDKTKRRRRAADEYIAHLAEKENLTPEERTIWDQIVQFFRESLDKALNGIIGKSQITNEDISNLIKASYANLKKEAGKDITSQIENARNEVDLDPTDAQKEAGNYKKGHVKIDGYDITIENPKGGTRSGTDKNGKEWSITMNNDYGYIRGTEAVDGDHIDIFLSDNPTEGNVFVVDQANEDGTFDESKVMYGFNSLEEARAAYLSNYDAGWENRIMAITEVSKDEFKKWIDSSHRKTKAFSEYKNVKVAPSIEETNVSRMADIEARILEIEGRRNEISDELAETPAYDVMKVAELRAEEWDLGQEQSELEAEYSGLRAMNDESNAILEEEGSELRFSAKKRRALETVSTSRKKHQQTVISSADGAKILNNLDNLAEKYENDTHTKEKTFIGEVAKAIEARKQGSGSQYSTFETVNGKIVTIRLADHNATVSNFDNRDESEGISIVVSAKDNNGITNDGDSHIVEYFYDSIDLRRADGKPLAEIVKSIKQSLYSGEYKDTTGLAERQEVNESRFRVVNDKNGNKSLIGLHNISEEKLRKAIKQGGLANPSMAVIDMDKQSHVDYGDITLIAPESLVNKKTGRNVGTYTADAYTPVYPTVTKQISNKGAKAFTKALESVDETFRNRIRLYFNNYLDSGTMYDALFYWFLSDTGKNPPILEAALPDGYTRDEVKNVKAVNPDATIFAELSEEERRKVIDLYIEREGGKEKYEDDLANRVEGWKKSIEDGNALQMRKKFSQDKLNELEEYGYEYDRIANYYKYAIRLANASSKPSEIETFRNAYDEVVKNGLEEDFGNWLMAKEEELGVEEKLFAGYDNQGRAKYVPNTLLNASKLMKKEGRAGATGLGGFNYFVAILAPVAKNTKQISAKKQNLSTQEEYDKFAKKWGEYYHKLALQLQPGADKWADYGYHRLHEIAPMANPKDYAKKEYGLELSDKFIKDLNDVKNAIKSDFPARYFETKFERPVYLNEFAAAVVPEGTSKDIVSALTDAGLPVEEYKKGNNEARMDAVDKISSEIDGIRFRRVYHGSGASFDKFDHSFMGTGEGNQSFGWGTYVTDSQGIGKQYAKIIGGEPVFTYKGMSKNEAYKMYPELQYLAFFMDRGDSAEEAIERRKSILNKVINTEGVDWFRKEMAEKSLEVLDSLDSSEMTMTKNRHLYEVEIPDNNGTNYLSWEEPLTEEQKERIKAALTKTDEYKSYAEKYGKELSEERVDTWLSAKGGAGRVYRFLENFFEDSDNSSKAVSELLSDAGFVGMEYSANYYGGGNSYGDNNYVIFNEHDLDIVEHTRFRIANRNQEIFVSNAERAVEGIKQEKGTPQQWLAMIEKNGGLKAGEDKWLGLSDWLKESDKKSLTKAEILDFINQNKIVIEEVKYSQNATDIDDLFDEYEALYENEGAEAAHTEMISRYGEEFDSAFKDVGGELRIVNQKVVDNLLSKSINSTRLKFTTIGLDNKAEIALAVPTIEPWNVDDEIHFGDAGEGRSVAWIRFGETAGYDVKLEKAVQEADNAVVEFQNSMADKYLPDGGSGDASEYIDYMSEDEVKELRKLIDAHLEAKYTLDNNMKRVLVIDEIQSKRHQEGREKGYRDDNALESLYKQREKLSEEKLNIVLEVLRKQGYNHWSEDNPAFKFDADVIDKAEDGMLGSKEQMDTIKDINIRLLHIKNEISRQRKGIPSAPFEKNWSELAMKRMLRYAAENDFDKVAWTKGAQQADRYNLRNVVDSIAISKSSKEEGKYHLTSYDKEDMPIDVASGNKTPEELTELFGKAVANELIEGVNNLEDGRDTFILEGAALEVGGEGMKGFYDKMLPSFVNKYVKKWGTKVQDIELPNVEEAGRFMHSVDVTEAMKESVMEGQTMFRISDKGRKIQSEVDKFTSKYNSKEVALIDSEMTDGELEDTMPFTTAKRIRKEIKEGTLGGYLPNTDKIYIFVDNQELDDLEDTLFHENMHAIFGETNIPNEFNEASKDKFKTLREVIRSNYPEKKWAEEVFVNVAANAMVNNDFKFIDKYLPEVYREEFYIKLKEFGYETEQEIRRRIVVGNTSSESGAQSEKRQAMEESDGGSRKSESTEQTERLRQLFDQVADMGLEGVLGNKEYASLMTDIYKALPEDVRLGVAESASKNYNGNVAPAVSDYLNHAEASIWDKVVAIIREALRKVGFDVNLNANDVKYILWRSKKPLDRRNVLDVAEDIDAIRRFRITGSTTRFKSKKKDNFDVSDKRDKLLKEYDAFLKTGKFNFIEAFQDRMYSLKVLMDKIVEATGKKVRDYEDAYKAENQLGSINKPMQEKYLKNFYKPLLEAMKTLSDKYGREVVERYIYCKSGLERNVVLRQRDADEAYNSSKAELDEKLAKNEIDQAQYNILLQQAEDQRQKTLSEDVDYSGIRGMLFNVKAQAIQKEHEEGKIDKNTRDARLNQLEANRSTVVKDWKKFAEDQVATLEGPGKASKAELDALWDKINAATNETLRMDYESGMIDQDTYNAEKNMMKYYVPLRNWDDTTAEEMYEYRSDLVRPVSSNQKRAKGRESQADNPIATIGLMAQSAIVRGNRNKVKQKFYAFVANRETSLATVRDVWYVKDPSTGDWTPQYADTTSAKDSAEFDAIIEQFEANMKALEEQGQAFRGKLPFGMKFKASASQKKAHVVPVMINGVEYAVYVNGNPRAAQAINGETNNESVKSTSEWIDKLKRLYGAGLTSWNPDFIIPNLVRDTIHASTMTMLDAGPMAAIKYMFNTPKMFWNVGKMVTGLGKANPKLEAYFKEFVDNGGETGYTAINTLEDYKKEYDKLIDEAKGIKASAGKNVKKAFEAIAKVLEAANRIAEDVNRFNAYVSARESGETIMRSVDAAKNITVNFNRKGALSANNTAFGTVANAMSKWILFFNPAVQGIAQIVTKSKMNPKRAASMGATILASGFMMPMLNEMLVAASGDDEEDNYWNQSDYKRRNNWMLFTGDGYMTFPLPPILRELYGIGDVMYGALTGHITVERTAMDIARQVQSAVGFFNLIPEVSQEPDMVTYAKGFAPDIAAPILDVISNTNFMGRPIAKWTDFNEYDPEYERVYKGTSKHWVELSMLLNEVGGNEGRRSDLWGNFINPAMMEHLITSYGGGIGKTINNLVGMALAEGEDNVDPFRKTPIIPRFYTPNDEKTVVPGINRKYYDYNYKYNVAKKALKNYQEGIESGEHPEWQKHIDEMKKNNEIEFINYFKAMDKKLKKLQNLLKGNPTNKEKLEEQIVDLKAMVSAKSWEILN